MESAQVISATPEYSTSAIFSLIFAVLAWTVLPLMGMALSGFSLMNMYAMPLVGSVIASAFAWVAQRNIRRSGGMLRGAGLAKAARIMALTQYILFAILLLFIGLSIWTHTGTVNINLPAPR